MTASIPTASRESSSAAGSSTTTCSTREKRSKGQYLRYHSGHRHHQDRTTSPLPPRGSQAGHLKVRTHYRILLCPGRARELRSLELHVSPSQSPPRQEGRVFRPSRLRFSRRRFPKTALQRGGSAPQADLRRVIVES